MDFDDDTNGHFNTNRAKTQMMMMMQASRILIGVFGIGGISVSLLALANAQDIGWTAAFQAGLLCIGLAGCMTIAAGALRGHLTLFKLIETVRNEEHEQRQMLTSVVQAAGDELRDRRNGT